MTATTTSALRSYNANRIVATLIPGHNRPPSHELYNAIGVKSYGTITCMQTECIINKHPNFLLLSSR